LVKRVCSIKGTTSKGTFLKLYKGVFDGLGCFPQKCPLVTQPNAAPVCRPPRGVPPALRGQLKEELDRLVHENIIVKITK
jgi:hypothetical protein